MRSAADDDSPLPAARYLIGRIFWRKAVRPDLAATAFACEGAVANFYAAGI
jgi:hypothetical protein